MYEHDSSTSPVVSYSLGRGIALLRWGGFWSAVCLPAVHVPLLLTAGLTSSSTPTLVALWVANLVALVLGRQHSPRHDSDGDVGGDRR